MTSDNQNLHLEFAILLVWWVVPLLACLLLALFGDLKDIVPKHEISGVVLDRRHFVLSSPYDFESLEYWLIEVQTLDDRIAWAAVTREEHDSLGIGSWWEGRAHD